ncbi:flagellar basal body-associated FliL family protein [uncultured Tateyamaria sp.]|uniref:flagellar basal body-associated FliL family protein n=1 Tax=uncultured Tateyamaria sp. TaxID=455651 RepID=UPI001E09C41F|nr:flagellar basal body-associated FliL family protein [uncultured Tateyamaria sp.]MCB4379166.1 flagellar basal body protein FliL [Synechococcus sp. MU1644]
MTDAAVDTDEEVKKPSKMPLIMGVVALLLGAGGGFFATFSGLILAPESSVQPELDKSSPADLPDVAFVPVEPMVISLAPNSHSRHLRFRAQLEVPSQYASDVESLLPRVVDVLNGYLRAIETADIESPAALTRLRAQMLRRVQIVAGPGRVNDLLIMEFVLS